MTLESLHPGTFLRQRVNQKNGLLVAGAANALAARVIQQVGFEAVYLSGAGITNTFYGIPDLGFIGLSDLAQHTAAVRDAVELPIIVDADTGFGNALNVRQSVRTLERSGANAIQLEDQLMPKKCGHFAGKAVVPADEMIGKIKAAVDARKHPDFLIIARTDARSVLGINEALDRAAAYAEHGADITFVEAPENEDEMRRIASELACPQIVNVVIGGKTPALQQQVLAEMGFGLVLYANAALQGAVRGMTNALAQLKATGELQEDPQWVATFSERQALVQKPFFDALEAKYK
jgi:2-methylisocitrate lyase-like PEP mutase family enzyme